MAVQLAKRLFSVDEFHRIAEIGIFSKDDRVELIEGEIIHMTPIGSRHAACVDRLNRLFSQRLGERAIVRIQSPVRLGQHSEPQPDLALLRLREDFYARAHPGPAEVLLIVEVAETSLETDRAVKGPLYSQAGIPEIWFVDLAQGLIELHREPSAQGYQTVRTMRRGASLAPSAFTDFRLTVDDILG